jgi:hypothetical protein
MKYALLTILYSLFIPVASAASFPDVGIDHPYYAAIEYVKMQGIVSGYPDGTFRPDQSINRAEFMKIIEGSIPEAEMGVSVCNTIEPSDAFIDVKTDEWFWLSVCMGRGRNIIGGYPDGTFRPSSLINFVETAKIIYNADHIDRRGIASPPPTAENPWFSPYVRYLQEHKAVPTAIRANDQAITRGQLAAMIYSLRTGNAPEGPVTSISEHLHLVDIAELLDKDSVPYIGKTITRFTTDTSGKHYAVVFYDVQSGAYQVYKDGVKIYDQKISASLGKELVPVTFYLTEDGTHLLYAIEPTVLYLDSLRLSSPDNLYNYYTATFSAIEKGHDIVYPESDQIVRYEPATQSKSVIFRYESNTMVFIRIEGDHYYFVVQNSNGESDLYKDGKKVSVVPVFNPTNYLVSADGSVYYFSKPNEAMYVLYRNDKKIFTGEGFGGFLFESPHHEIYHVGYTLNSDQSANVHLFKQNRKISDQPLGNIESFIAYSDDAIHFATRSSKQSNPSIFYLYKDGKWIGTPFSFAGKKDFTGVQFAGAAAYMRNFMNGRWQIFKDGAPIAGDAFVNAWYLRTNGEDVSVYGTKF